MNITSKTYENRRERLRAKLEQAGIDALLVSHAANRFYLSGFELHDPQCNESSGYLLVRSRGRDILMTDSRYLDAAKRLWPEEDIFIYGGPRNQKIREYLAGLDAGTIGFEAKSICVETFEELRQELSLKPTAGLVEDLRWIKDEAELAIMERSCALNQAVFSAVQDMIAPGMTETEVAWHVEQLFRNRGASELAFSTIVGVGPNAALPHARPGDVQLRRDELVLVDAGARLGDYCSDQTRTFWVGDKPSPRFQETMERVREAQDAAIAAIRPGLPIREAYLIARGVFEKYGVETAFTHALGHGIGLETHEGPSLSSIAQGVFQPGMVVTVEPGLYYPDWGGIRWEYMIVVTEDGARVL